jgi:hypothetical protein
MSHVKPLALCASYMLLYILAAILGVLSSYSSAQGPTARTLSSRRANFSTIHRRNGPKGHMKTPSIGHEDVDLLVRSLETNLLMHLDAGKSLSMQCGRGSLAKCCRGSSSGKVYQSITSMREVSIYAFPSPES